MHVDDMIMVSIDDHVIEPPDMYKGHVPAKWLDEVPKVGGSGKLYGAPLVDAQHSFYLFQYKKGEFLAIAASAFPSLPPSSDIGVSVIDAPGGPPPSFDHYLVSVEGTKVVVNTSRLINGTEVVPAPSPTR